MTLSKMPEKAFPVSWDQFHRDARALSWRLAGQGKWEAIVCVTRGGLVLYDLTSTYFEGRHCPLGRFVRFL